jgi:hypothetical protein
VVQQAWEREVSGISPLNKLYYRMKNTAKALKQWSTNLFGKARLELCMANEVIHQLDIAQENRPLSAEERVLWCDLKIKVLGLAAIERSRRRQASRLIWLKEGDTCTRFFHLRANKRKRKNFIPYLKNNSGTCVWDHKPKEEVLYEHLSNMLGSTTQWQTIINWAELQFLVLHENVLDNPFGEVEIK